MACLRQECSSFNVSGTTTRSPSNVGGFDPSVDGAVAFKQPLSVDDLSDAIPLTQTSIGLLPPPDLTEEQAERLLARMRERQ